MSATTRRGKFFAGTSQTGNPQSGAMATAAANFNIPPPATFNPQTDDWNQWISRYELFEAAKQRDGLSCKVILNMRLRTTSGQSTPSVVIGVIGKTTDFLSNYLLRLPPQYVIMTYFSSTLVYINGVQVIWYLKPQPKSTTMMPSTYSSNRALNEELLEVDDCDECSLIGDPKGSVEADGASEEKMVSVCTEVISTTTDLSARIRGIPSYQRLFAVYLCLAVAAFSVCVCLNTPSNWGIFAPPVVFVVLLCALLYRNYREGRMYC